MRKMKKFLAMLLALVMVMGMSVTVFAEGETTQNPTNPTPILKTDNVTGKRSDRGTIIVSGLTPEYQKDTDGNPTTTLKKLTVTAYQIVEAKYESAATDDKKTNGFFSGYKGVYGDNTVNIDREKEEITVSDAQLTDLLDKITKATDKKSYNLSTTDGKTYTSGENQVPVGAYLVVISGAENKIYSNVVVSVQYVPKKNTGSDTTVGNEIQGANLNIASNPGWVKVQDNPTLNKTIVGSDNNTKGNTANMGDTVQYKILADIPYYGGDYPTFNIVDNLDGLTYKYNGTETKTDSLVVKVVDATNENTVIKELKKGTDYWVMPKSTPENLTPITNQITIDFVDPNNSKNYTLQSYVQNGEKRKVLITYDATVNADAKLNQEANTNEATLNYTHDSKVSGNDGTSTSKTNTYTFDIDGQAQGAVTEKILTKLGEMGSTTVTTLENAKFTIYEAKKDASGKVVIVKGDDGKDKVYKNTSSDNPSMATGVITSTRTADNNLQITGLKAGYYILKETEAPQGYALNTNEYVIEIHATIDNDGKLTEWYIKINDEYTASFTVTNTSTKPIVNKPDNAPYKIYNTKIVSLPSTGGIGTTIFTIGGCAIMIIAAGLYFAMRRKSAK